MAKENMSFLVCCANGAGSSLMMKMTMQKALDKVGIKPGKIHHCALSEGKTAAAQYDVVFCAQNFTNMFKDAEKKGTIVIGLANVIIGTQLFKRIPFVKATSAVIIGSILYKACVSLALSVVRFQIEVKHFVISFPVLASDLKLITAILFLVILVAGNYRERKGKDSCSN